MKRIKVNTSKTYEVLIGSGLIAQTGALVEKIIKPCKAMIVSETNVAPLYLKRVKQSLENSGFRVYTSIFKAGEKQKNLKTVGKIVGELANNEFSRTDIIVALGGGVTGDTAGFVASIFLRGIRFIQIPTTLLAMVDSSVGGKTAVDIKQGKNLVGCFHQPSLVICDTDTLKTCNKSIIAQGLSEALKCGLIKDKSLYKALLSKEINFENVAYKCVSIKAKIVENDEFDNGERLLLNYGHTFGHAVEKLSNFKIAHGEAVAIGMIMACEYSKKTGGIDLTSEVENALEKLGLPTKNPYKKEDVLKVMMTDKKRRGDNINLVLVNEIGNGEIVKVDIETFSKNFLEN